jgi:hypothetical protein
VAGFPQRPVNAPAQPRLAYRIGRYPDFREAMLRAVDAAPELAAWTHRQSDDPGIALVEGAAILGDILSFYQEHYANEAFLRTAAWRESVAELVRLTGYRLAPGLAGRATFAFEARGSTPVTIRAAFPIKAELETGGAPSDFETDAALVAWPHLGRTHLYVPRFFAETIPAGAGMVELAAPVATELKPGERLMLIPADETPGTTQVIVIRKVTRILDRTVLELEKPIVAGWNAPVRAFRVGRTFRHFGHNAPPQFVRPVVEASGDITGSSAEDTRYERSVSTGASISTASSGSGGTSAPSSSSGTFTGMELEQQTHVDESLTSGVVEEKSPWSYVSSIDWYSDLGALEIPLDQEAADFAIGGTVILEGRTPLPFVVARTAVAARAEAVQWANVGGPSTIVTLDAAFVSVADAEFDIRDLRIHEVKSPELLLRPVPAPSSGEFTSGAQALAFFGMAVDAQAIAGRRLFLSHSDGRNVLLTCTNVAAEIPVPASDVPQCWTLSFDRPPTPFRLEDFSEEAPTVTVFGNLVDASQGRSEREAVLGNGDPRRAFQTFALPKSPLTYLLTPGGQVPELEIWVGGRLWTQVDALFGHGPDETIYIVREDAEGRSFVQFGDGETGARPPSGLKNIRAVYRTGTGAHGVLKAGAAPTVSERPPGFSKVALAGIVAGGADPEDEECARHAAPGKVQSLGRIVSITDYETEALVIPGVISAAASWDLHVGVPVVLLRVLLEAGREAEFAAVQSALHAAQRSRGPDRFPIVVEQSSMRAVYLDLSYCRDFTFAAEAVEAAVRLVLSEEIFGLRARRLGQPEHASRIEGRVQNVPGIEWCRVTAFGVLSGFELPAAPRPLAATVGCAPNELLQLAETHLSLIETAAAS